MYNHTLRFGFEKDRGGIMQISIMIREAFWPMSVFIVHPFVIFVLLKKTQMHRDYRTAHVVHHLFMVAFDVYSCHLFQLYPLLPYPAFCCTGLLCTETASFRVLWTGLTVCAVFVCLPYLFVIVRTHQTMLPNCHWLRMRTRWQFCIMAAFSIVLFANVYGFAAWSEESSERLQLLQNPDIAWSRELSPNFLVLGPAIGVIGDWMNEMYLLFISILLIFSLYAGITYHDIFHVGKHKALFTLSMFVLPQCLFTTFLVFDLGFLPAWPMPYLRSSMMVMYSCCSINHSVIFIYKNAWCLEMFKRLFGVLYDRGAEITMKPM